MARLIDADAFIQEHCDDCKYFRVNGICTHDDPVCGSVQIVMELPTVDAVEVVRCKDCKHYDNSEGICWCHLNSKFYPGGVDWHSFPEDGFCSSGERRTDNA